MPLPSVTGNDTLGYTVAHNRNENIHNANVLLFTSGDGAVFYLGHEAVHAHTHTHTHTRTHTHTHTHMLNSDCYNHQSS
jgi:hypothetical protein